MTIPSITDVFGANATQTATAITIQKADLPTLTASTTNNGQELFVGILLAAIAKLTPAARSTDPDVKIEISYSGQTVFPGTGGNNNRQDTYSIILHKTVPAESVDADDY